MLHVVIADECHSAITLNGAHDYFINDRHDKALDKTYKGEDRKGELLDCDNLLVLLVSATPYNVVAKHSYLEEGRIVHWFPPPPPGSNDDDASKPTSATTYGATCLTPPPTPRHLTQLSLTAYLLNRRYIRLEDYLQSSADEKRALVQRNVRGDPWFNKVCPDNVENRRGARNYRLVTDYLFSMAYMRAFRWDPLTGCLKHLNDCVLPTEDSDPRVVMWLNLYASFDFAPAFDGGAVSEELKDAHSLLLRKLPECESLSRVINLIGDRGVVEGGLAHWPGRGFSL